MRPCVPALDAVLNEPTPILDKGFIRVIDYMGDSSAVVQAARVSYGKGTKTPSDDRGLIRYLMRHRHTSCFEMCEIKFHVKLPIFVARQWIRHRTANVNEISARYSIIDQEFHIPTEVRRQSSTNKQGSEGRLPVYQNTSALVEFRDAADRDGVSYEKLLHLGVSREQARMVLPQNIYTEMYWKTDLHNLLNFIALRSAPNAQAEIQEYARVMHDLVRLWVPDVVDAFEDYRLNAVTLSARGRELVEKLICGAEVTEGMSEMSKGEWREFAKEWMGK